MDSIKCNILAISFNVATKTFVFSRCIQKHTIKYYCLIFDAFRRSISSIKYR